MSDTQLSTPVSIAESKSIHNRNSIHIGVVIGTVALYTLLKSFAFQIHPLVVAGIQSSAIVTMLLVGIAAVVSQTMHKKAALTIIAQTLITAALVESVVLTIQTTTDVHTFSAEVQMIIGWLTAIEPLIFPLLINSVWIRHYARLKQLGAYSTPNNPLRKIIITCMITGAAMLVLVWTNAFTLMGIPLGSSRAYSLVLYAIAYSGLSMVIRWRRGPLEDRLLTTIMLMGLAQIFLASDIGSSHFIVIAGYGFKIAAMLLLFSAISKSTQNLIYALRLSKDQNALLVQQRLLKQLDDQKLELEAKGKELEEQKLALVNVLEDITQEKDLEHTQNESLLGIIGEGIIITDSQGAISYINQAAQELIGFTHRDLAGKDFAGTIKTFDLNHQPIPPAERSDSAAITVKGGERKVLIGTKDGSQVAVSVNATPINFLGEYQGVIRVLHDFSQDLELQQQKDNFFSIASHELRTPLTVIGGNVDMLLQGYGDSQLSQEDTELLQDTATATERLIRMVNSFLDVSRLDQGRLKLSTTQINIQELSKKVVAEMQVLAQKHNINLSYTCHTDKVMVTGDLDKLREVLINLIGNSLKFTKEGSITVKHGADDTTMYLSVIDTGTGIEKDKQGLLFQRFQQAMSRTLAREAGGTGLGLYISREFVRRMGGDLVLVSSDPGIKTEFMVTLPIATARAVDTELSTQSDKAHQ